MNGGNKDRDIAPRPEWSFAELVQHCWSIYTGGGIESIGRRNIIIRVWASMVGSERALSELEYFISLHNNIEEAAEVIGCRTSTLLNLKKQFSYVGINALSPVPLSLAKGEELKGKNETYSVDKKIGSGGMSVVYEVEGKNTSNRFAAKVLSSERFNITSTIKDRFEREYKIAKTFTSKYVVKSVELIRYRGTIITIQELLSGKNIYDEISKAEVNFDIELRIKWIIDITKGLAYLHSNKIIHRDLSPRNCLFRNDGTVALGDFGVARRFDDHTMTTFHDRMGSIIYISPQQRENPHLTNYNDDVYSLGQLAYHILTNISPHGGIEQISNLGYPQILDDWVKGLRQSESSKRPKNAEICLKELNDIILKKKSFD